MKIHVQAKNESVVIDGEITVTVLDIVDDEVILAIDAPAWRTIDAEEFWAASAPSLPGRPR